jgi:biotin transport system substrate-specific component
MDMAARVSLIDDRVVRELVYAGGFGALTGALAVVAIPTPLSPVPVSLGVLGVFLTGVYLPPRAAGGAMLLYLLAGALGAPVFAGGAAGIGPLVGYTAGYLWAYPPAAVLIAAVASPQARPRRLIGSLLLATVVIYAAGTVGFALVQRVTIGEAFIVSALAFVPAELAKILATVAIVRVVDAPLIGR